MRTHTNYLIRTAPITCTCMHKPPHVILLEIVETNLDWNAQYCTLHFFVHSLSVQNVQLASESTYMMKISWQVCLCVFLCMWSVPVCVWAYVWGNAIFICVCCCVCEYVCMHMFVSFCALRESSFTLLTKFSDPGVWGCASTGRECRVRSVRQGSSLTHMVRSERIQVQCALSRRTRFRVCFLPPCVGQQQARRAIVIARERRCKGTKGTATAGEGLGVSHQTKVWKLVTQIEHECSILIQFMMQCMLFCVTRKF